MLVYAGSSSSIAWICKLFFMYLMGNTKETITPNCSARGTKGLRGSKDLSCTVRGYGYGYRNGYGHGYGHGYGEAGTASKEIT
jgi:hypothetical protein